MEQLITEAKKAGLSVLVSNGRLVMTGPKSAQPIALRLIDRKVEVLAFLQAQTADQNPLINAVLNRWPGAVVTNITKYDPVPLGEPVTAGICAQCGSPDQPLYRYGDDALHAECHALRLRNAPSLHALTPSDGFADTFAAALTNPLKAASLLKDRLGVSPRGDCSQRLWEVFLSDAVGMTADGTVTRLVDAGWSLLYIFGCDPTVPWSRMDCSGLALTMAGSKVALIGEKQWDGDIDLGVVVLQTPAGARQRYWRDKQNTTNLMFIWDVG